MKKIIASFALIAVLATSANVFAGGVSDFSSTMTRQKVSETGDQTIVFTTTAPIADNETFVINYPFGFDISAAVFPAVANFDAAVIDAPNLTVTYQSNSAVDIAASTAISISATGIVNPALSSEDAATAGTCPEAAAVVGTGTVEATCYQLSLTGTATDIAGAVVLPVLEDDQVMITATVEPELLFELHSDDDDQADIFFDDDANTVDLGVLTSANVKYATPGVGTGGSTIAPAGGAHGFRIGTNASAGYAVTIVGPTLVNGNGDEIAALGNATTASAPGTEQFGLCLEEDTTGAAGVAASALTQTGVLTPAFDCGTGFAFDATGANIVATGNVAGPTNSTFYDVNYTANIDALTPAGNYMTMLT